MAEAPMLPPTSPSLSLRSSTLLPPFPDFGSSSVSLPETPKNGELARKEIISENVQNVLLRKLDELHEVLVEHQARISTRLESLEERITGIEHRLEIEEEVCVAVKKKSKIPKEIRASIRDTYAALVGMAESDFFGWVTTQSYSSPHNMAASRRLLEEVKSRNPHYRNSDIQGAMRTFFKTRSEIAALVRADKLDNKRKACRRRERMIRKLNERKSTLLKSDLPTDEQEKWMPVMVKDFMSSEDSGEDVSLDGQSPEAIFICRPIPWRAPVVETLFCGLDSRAHNSKRTNPRRKFVKRIIGEQSKRLKPVGSSFPPWAIK